MCKIGTSKRGVATTSHKTVVCNVIAEYLSQIQGVDFQMFLVRSGNILVEKTRSSILDINSSVCKVVAEFLSQLRGNDLKMSRSRRYRVTYRARKLCHLCMADDTV